MRAGKLQPLGLPPNWTTTRSIYQQKQSPVPLQAGAVQWKPWFPPCGCWSTGSLTSGGSQKPPCAVSWSCWSPPCAASPPACCAGSRPPTCGLCPRAQSAEHRTSRKGWGVAWTKTLRPDLEAFPCWSPSRERLHLLKEYHKRFYPKK